MPAIMSHTTSPGRNSSTSLQPRLSGRGVYSHAHAHAPLVLVLQPRVPVHLAVVQPEHGAVLPHLRLQPCSKREYRAARNALRQHTHLEARVASKHFEARHAELALNRAHLRRGPLLASAWGVQDCAGLVHALFRRVLIFGAFLSSSTRPMTRLKGSSSSRRFRCAMWPTVSKEPGTSEPAGSSACAPVAAQQPHRRSASARGAWRTRAFSTWSAVKYS